MLFSTIVVLYLPLNLSILYFYSLYKLYVRFVGQLCILVNHIIVFLYMAVTFWTDIERHISC